mmetsp:Transcript_69691/g.179665  ORF Transcript_69691/g.179665 Transcript_69691/m.179665 type:complete len:676 (-) Transcript_69691:856-2883(-)
MELVHHAEVLQPTGPEVVEGVDDWGAPDGDVRRGVRVLQQRDHLVQTDGLLLRVEDLHELRARDKTVDHAVVVDDGEAAVGGPLEELHDLADALAAAQHDNLGRAHVVDFQAIQHQQMILAEVILQQMDVGIHIQHDVVDAGAELVGHHLADHDDQHQRHKQVHIVGDLQEDHRQRDGHAAEAAKRPSGAHERVHAGVHVEVHVQERLPERAPEARPCEDVGDEEPHGDRRPERADRREEDNPPGDKEGRDAHVGPSGHLLAKQGPDRPFFRRQEDVAQVRVGLHALYLRLWADAACEHRRPILQGAAEAPRTVNCWDLAAAEEHRGPEADGHREQRDALHLQQPAQLRLPRRGAELEEAAAELKHPLHGVAEERPQQALYHGQGGEGPQLPQGEGHVEVREGNEAGHNEGGEAALGKLCEQCRDDGAQEGPPRQSLAPEGRCLLEAEEDAADGRAEGGGHAHGGALRDELAAVAVPEEHAWPRNPKIRAVSKELGHHAAEVRKGALCAREEPRGGHEHEADRARVPGLHGEALRHRDAVQEGLDLRDTAAACVGRHVGHEGGGHERRQAGVEHQQAEGVELASLPRSAELRKHAHLPLHDPVGTVDDRACLHCDDDGYDHRQEPLDGGRPADVLPHLRVHALDFTIGPVAVRLGVAAVAIVSARRDRSNAVHAL